MARLTFRRRGLFWSYAPKSWSGTFPISKLFQGSPENLGKTNAHFSMCKNTGTRLKKFFDDIYVSFEIRVEAVSLILHRHNNSFNGTCQKNCRKLLLRNVVNCGSTCMASRNNSVPEVYHTQYFGHARLMQYTHNTSFSRQCIYASLQLHFILHIVLLLPCFIAV